MAPERQWLPSLAGFFENVDIFFAERSAGMDGVVFVDEFARGGERRPFRRGRRLQ